MGRIACLGGLLWLLMAPAAAQDTQSLQQQVNDLRATVQALQAEVKQLKAGQGATPPTPATANTATAAPVSPSANATPAPIPANSVVAAPLIQSSNALEILGVPPSPLPAQQTVSGNAEGASRIDNEAPPTDPNLKGFLQIPGTQTLIRLGGYAKLDAIYDTSAIGTPDQFVTAAIPVPRPHDNSGNFTLQARQTRLSLEVRRTTMFDESMRFYFENDFYGGGPGEYQFRVRQAYGQLGNTYAGYGWTAFADVDALPDTLDFAGPGGSIGLRQASIRQAFHLTPTTSLTLSAENPTTEVASLDQDGSVRGTQHVPDLVVAARTEHPWGHLQLGVVGRQLSYSDDERSDRVLGGGVSLDGAFKTNSGSTYNDLLMFGTVWGKGIAHYMGDTGGAGLDAAVSPTDGKLHALPGWGAYAAYTHYWTGAWRSNLVYGVANIDTSRWLPNAPFHESTYGAANLLWNPVPTLTMGVELLHGRLEQEDGRSNNDTRLQGSLQYSFVK